MQNIMKEVMTAVKLLYDTRIFIAEVTGLDGGRVIIRRIGNSVDDQTHYPYIISVSTSDLVLCISVRGEVIVIGQVNQS